MEEINNLLSDKYVEFARKIIALQLRKKCFQSALQNANNGNYQNIVNQLNHIRSSADNLQEEYESWKRSLNCGDG